MALHRARVLRAYDHGERTTILGDDGRVVRFEGDSAGLARAILEACASPLSREALLARLSELAGAAVAWEGAVADTIAHLEAAGALATGDASPAPAPPPRSRDPRRVLLGITGAVAAAFAPALVQLLQARGHDVRVAATLSALRFVAPLALEALTHAPVVASLWPRVASEPVPHLELARWAEIVVVYPASATSIARLAAGHCGNVVSATAIATRAPVLVVPSMNHAMWAAPSVQRNVAQLVADGFCVAHPSRGHEVADAPAARGLVLGAAPPVQAVADLIARVLADQPRSPETMDWDAAYRDASELPWSTDTLDADIAAALDAIPRGAGRLLDVGTGSGTAAIAAADRGFTVVATDISERAIAIGRSRAGARPILFLVDDARRTALRGAFDVALDRGLCHALPERDQAGYAASLAALLVPGGHLVLKCHAASEPADHGTRRFAEVDVAALFAGAFDLVRCTEGVFPGPRGHAPRALLCVLRRRADVAGEALGRYPDPR
jgi:SAM-dependent methyltransferase